MKKKCIFRWRIVMMVAIIFQCNVVYSQESIELLQSEGSEKSIVRELSPTSWLVYSNPGYHDFSIVNDDSTHVRIIRLPENLVKTVSDFKIYKDRVYLCGMLEIGLPYWGYFDYNEPEPYFYYIPTSKVEQLKHLVVYGSESEKLHVVMTADGHDGRGMIVEAMGVPYNWFMYYVTPFVNHDENYAFDDIAIGEKYIAFTSYCTDDLMLIDTLHSRSIPLSRLWYIDKPSSVNNPAAYSLFNYRDLSYYTHGRFIVRNCQGDVFVTAADATQTYPIFMISSFYISAYDGTSHLATVEISPFSSQAKVRDLCYNPISMCTELLVSTSTPAQSSFYTLLPSMAYASGVAYGHRFDDCLANSIVRQTSTSMQFISTAYNMLNTSNLDLIRYHSSYTGECSNLIKRETKLIENDGAFIQGNKTVYDEAVILGGKKCYYKVVGIDPLCGNNNQ